MAENIPSYERAGEVLRYLIESAEEDPSEGYLREIHSYVNHVYEPILYEELNRQLDEEDFEELTTDQSVKNTLQDSLKEEFNYWEKRYSEANEGLGHPVGMIRLGLLERLQQDFQNYDTVIACAVRGVPYGIVARNEVEPENFGIVGYEDGEDVREGEDVRPVSFSTQDEMKGESLIVDNATHTGATVRGTVKELESRRTERVTFINDRGDTYEFGGVFKKILNFLDMTEADEIF